jgi:hypothetical protein
MNNSHRRQGSSGSFSHDSVGAALHVSFSSLENFMAVSKHMHDEIMVPSKLKDKTFGKIKISSFILQINNFLNITTNIIRQRNHGDDKQPGQRGARALTKQPE